MLFDPSTLLVTALLILMVMGGLLVVLSKGEPERKAGYWWFGAFFLAALGFVCLLLLKQPNILVRIVMNSAFLGCYACFYNGSRSVLGRSVVLWPLVLAVLTWPVVGGLWAPDFQIRSMIFSWGVALFVGLSAYEYAAYGRAQGRSNILASGICGAHALFYFVRGILGPDFVWGRDVSDSPLSAWAAWAALEAIVFASAVTIVLLTMSQQKMASYERNIANTDYLTGIGNRRAFETTLNALLTRDLANPNPALLLLDLDNFKAVNDKLGHQAGDDLLKECTRIVQAYLPAPRAFWRLGGDEFAIVVVGQTAQQIDSFKNGLRAAVDNAQAMASISKGIRVTVSVGSVIMQSGQNLAQLLQLADKELYRDKLLGR